jgi:hypothetical protein
MLPDLPQGAGMRRPLYQRDETMQEGAGLRVLRCRQLLTGLPVSAIPTGLREHHANMAPVDHGSFRDQLAFSIGYAVSRSRDLLRRLLKEHITDDARQQLAERVVEHLELSGFEIDEQERIMRKQDGGRGW